MAAHMQRGILIPRVFLENSRVCLKEYSFSRNFITRHFSVGKDVSETPSEISSVSETQRELGPNPTSTFTVSSISETAFEDSRKSRKIDPLIKPAELGDASQSFAKLFRESNFTNVSNSFLQFDFYMNVLSSRLIV